MSAVGDARKRTQQAPAGTLTDTEQAVRVMRPAMGDDCTTDELRAYAVRLRKAGWVNPDEHQDAVEAAVAAALAPIEALAAEWEVGAATLNHPRENGVTKSRGIGIAYCADRLRAALAGGGDHV